MDILHELAFFIKKNLSRSKPVGAKIWKRDKSDVFYEKLKDEEFKNDEEAAKYFYGVKDHRYIELKMRTLDNLITSVLLLDFKSKRIHSNSKAYYSMLREMAVANILLGNTYHKSAIYLAKRCYRKSEQLGYYNIMYDSARMLCNHYGIRVKNLAKYQEYKSKLKAIKRVLALEDRANNYYADLLFLQKKSGSSTQKVNDKAREFVRELSPYLSSCKSMRYQLVTRLIRNTVSATNYDYETMVSDSDEDIDYFIKNHNSYTTYTYFFLYQKSIACIRLGHFEQGLFTINQTLDLIGERDVNWFSAQYNKFFIYMQSGKYQEAQILYLKVINHRRYKTIVSAMKEDWITGGAYLNYIIEKGELESHSKFKFKVGKFLNEVPEYSKDRRVKHIPILIAQIIFMIYRKQTGKVIDRMDAIKQYCGRNLRYNEAVRSNSFIMALMEIPKHSFNRIAVERHIVRFTKRLEEVPLHLSGKNFDLEIIPYERLLGYVLEDL